MLASMYMLVKNFSLERFFSLETFFYCHLAGFFCFVCPSPFDYFLYPAGIDDEAENDSKKPLEISSEKNMTSRQLGGDMCQ